MSQQNFIKDIVRFGLENNQVKLLDKLNEFVEYNKTTKKINFALQLQSLIKDYTRKENNRSLKISPPTHYSYTNEKELDDLILEKLTSNYYMSNLVLTEKLSDQLNNFLEEHRQRELLSKYNLPISNKLLLFGPSGCGKTLASYVIAGELKKTMIVVNLGAIVSSKLGETSKNIAKIFQKAQQEDCIIFIDEFDSLGKVRDYSQDHGEMKRVVNTIIQLFDYLPQGSMIISATNQKEMLDEALLRRFDLAISLELPEAEQIEKLFDLVLKEKKFEFDNIVSKQKLIEMASGLSHYSIQKTLNNAIKRSLFAQEITENIRAIINTKIWQTLLEQEKKALAIK